ncbi:MAG: RidA family protein [Rhodobacterales bacterium]|jgi:2-iminobutanoate/2-iminopropanoate deaminase|tara:strand:+ start:564 stop:947 length:384 start_codon:yes stop_codon:yes gene_type:complete
MVNSINPEGLPAHKNPIPAAAVHKGILISSVISGKSVVTGSYSKNKVEQVSLVFEYIKKIVIEAGGTVQDIIKMDLYFSDKSDRSIVNPEWVKMFPDPNKRPARHAQIAELPKDCCLQVTLTAVIET